MTKLFALLTTLIFIAVIGVAALLSLSWLSSERIASATFIAAQATILSCRTEKSAITADKLCGPVPSLEEFRSHALPQPF